MAANNTRPFYAAIVILGIIAILSVAALFVSQDRFLFGSGYSIPVTATGTASAVPTQIDVSLQVNANGTTAGMATANISSALNTLNQTLYRYLNGNLSKISTQSYSLSTNYATAVNNTKYLKCMLQIGNSSICSSEARESRPYYVASEDLKVTLPQTQSIGMLLQNLSEMNSISVGAVSATLSDAQISALRQQALQNAIQNATSEAKALVGNNTQIYIGNITVGGSSYYPYYYNYGTFSAASLATTATAPQYYVGVNKVTESIVVAFHYSGMPA
ncbi:MAG: SIMPL domain-containing protein [Candidatus Marsarchaeota archaeon]|nr:SIMPL domain-containing protein [Candidatus Marsarchaeota archaeon]